MDKDADVEQNSSKWSKDSTMVRIEFIMNAVKGPLVVGLGNPVAVARSNRILDVDVSELIATLSLVEDTRVRTLCALLCPKIILASEDWVNCAESARKAALEGRDFLLVGLFRLHSGFLQLGLWPMVQFCLSTRLRTNHYRDGISC
jgi:hypothetical protein